MIQKFEASSARVSESAARRAADRVGLRALKSRCRSHSAENHGGFMLVDVRSGIPVTGFCYDLSAEDVAAYCGDLEALD